MSSHPFWPNADDYRQAILKFHVMVADEELRRGQPVMNSRRKAMLWAGNFAAVFRIHCPAIDHDDVWRLGPSAVALFGKDMSLPQQQLLDRFLPGRPVVVFLDRDAQDKAAELQRTLLNRGRVTVLAGLPDGRDDVGDCTTEEAWQQVTQPISVISPAASPEATPAVTEAPQQKHPQRELRWL
jgi:hypothetical protein